MSEEMLFNKEAEQSIIGSILIDQNAFNRVGSIVSPEDFYFKEHYWIMKAITDLAVLTSPVDIVSVADNLKSTDKLDFVGGVVYLAKLAAAVPETTNVDYYAKIVKEKSLCRQARKIGVQKC